MNIVVSPWHLIWLLPIGFVVDIYFGGLCKPHPFDKLPKRLSLLLLLIGAVVCDVGYIIFSHNIRSLLDLQFSELVPIALIRLMLGACRGTHPFVIVVGFAWRFIILQNLPLPLDRIYWPNIGYRMLVSLIDVLLTEAVIWSYRKFSKKTESPPKPNCLWQCGVWQNHYSVVE